MGSLVLVSITLSIVGLAAPEERLGAVFFAAAAALLGFIACMYVLVWAQERHKRLAFVLMSEIVSKDATPCLIATGEGEVLSLNTAARRHFAGVEIETIPGALDTTVANPGGIVYRLQTRADVEGSAHEDIITRKGNLRLSVHRIIGVGYVWRIDVQRAETPSAEGPALPMALLGRSDVVLHLNSPARKLLGEKHKSLSNIIEETPVVSGTVCTIASSDGPTRALVCEVDAGAGRRALYFLPPGSDPAAANSWNAFQNLPVPLLKVAPDGTVQAFNRMAFSLIGETLSPAVHLSELMEGLGRSIGDWLTDTLAGRMGQPSEFLRLKRTDKEIFVQVSLNKISEAGEPALIAVLSDATELKSLEAQFVQSQKMQAIGQLAGGVAHDFNNLLTAISGHCDLLLLRHDQGDPDFGDLVQINQNANRAAALVGQLLAFSRKQTLRPETLDMRDTLADLTHLLNRLVGEKVTLTLNHDPILQPIRADKRQLEQVLMNLVVNARDAMPDGGEIKILTECTHLKEPLTRDRVTVPPGDYVTVQVIDGGVGIPPDKLQKVFEPFFTTKRTGEGTGLGLSTAYGIVKQTGGYIFVDSQVGSGTSFTLYFPVLERKEVVAAVTHDAPARSLAKHGDGVILLVEDEAPVRAFASRALRLRGYTVLEADSAEAALKTLEDKTLTVDVFVTDVVMPGMDGPSWVRKALKDRPDVRVVFVSGYAEDSFGEEQTKIPNSVFLPKPFSLNDLTDTVHQQLH